MSIRKILITGGSGFIGTNLVKFLISKNIEIHNIDKISYCSIPDKFTNFPKKKYFFYKVDLLKINEIEKILLKVKPEIIINLAADSHVDRSIDAPGKFIKNNIISCLNLLECIKKNKKRIKLKKFIHMSTDEVFGGDNKIPSKENDKYETNSPYSASKASCDSLCRAFYKTYKIPIIVVHCCNNYGPFQFTEKFIPTVISKYINKEEIPLYGTGKNIREWIYVEDFCAAIFKILNKGKISETYNIGSNERISNINILKIVLNIISKNLDNNNYKPVIKKVTDRPGHDFIYQINSNKVRKKFNWKNNYNLKDGLKKTILWYLQNKNWLSHCKRIYKGNRQGLLKND
jgi:dTDP-glucose 4,6-dehydratase